MLTAWTTFAKYGDPNGKAEDGKSGDSTQWTPCTREHPDFMLFKLDADNQDDSKMGTPIKAQ